MASVGSIVGGAFALFRDRPGAVALWALTYIVGTILISLVFAGVMMASMSGMDPASMSDPASMMRGMFGSVILVYLCIFFLMIILMNAVFRSILRPEERSFGSIRIGMDEVRMFGLFIVFFIAMVVLWLVVMLIFSLLAAALGMAAGANGAGAVGILMALVLVAAAVWFYVRVSLLFPLSFYRRSFIELDGAWRMTGGRFWTLFASYLIVWVITLAMFLAIFFLTFGPGFLSAMGGGGNPEAMAEQAAMAGGFSPIRMIIFFVLYLILAVVSIVLGPAIIASATKQILIEEGDPMVDVEQTAAVFE